jgi:hypothetical protein
MGPGSERKREKQTFQNLTGLKESKGLWVRFPRHKPSRGENCWNKERRVRGPGLQSAGASAPCPRGICANHAQSEIYFG